MFILQLSSIICWRLLWGAGALILQHFWQPSLCCDCVHASALAQSFGLSLKKLYENSKRQEEMGRAKQGCSGPPLLPFRFTHSILISLYLHACKVASVMAESLRPCSLHGILQARTLEWIAMPSSREFSWAKYWAHVSYVSCTGKQVLYHSCHLGRPITVFGHLLFKMIVSSFK